jgi:hypothetical protein
MKQALAASADQLDRKGQVGRERVHRLHDSSSNAEELLRFVAG